MFLSYPESDFFAKNREKLVSKLNAKSIAIVHSNDEMHRTGDQNYSFRQSSNLFYLTGIMQEKTILVLFPDHFEIKMREILFIRKNDKNIETWQGHKLSPEEAQKISGIRNIRFEDEFEATLREMLPLIDSVYVDIPEFAKYTPDSPYRGQKFLVKFKSEYPAFNIERLFPLIARLRMIKEPEEIRLMNKACEITHGGFRQILKSLKPGIFEYEIEAALTYEFIRNRCTHAYKPIIASGKNACILHYETNMDECKDGDLVLMDFGADYLNYSSDLSRTIPVNGRFTERQRKLYDAVLRVFKFARELMKPEATINSIHEEVCMKWEEEHIKLGLYSLKDVQNNKEKEKPWMKYYMHGTSHFLGLDVHDTGNKNDILRPGMVITCEPGIYIPEENVGIRIENDILITSHGNKDLMEAIPVEAEEIEEIMNS